MNTSNINFGQALSYMFEEEDWVTKFAITVGMYLLSFLILPAFIVQGYMLDIIRRVARHQKPTLPAWEDWGKYLSQGFMVTLAQFIYGLPFIVFACCFQLLAAGAGGENGGELAGGLTLILCCLFVILFILYIPVIFIYFVGLLRYAETQDFGDFFQFGRLWAKVQKDFGGYAKALGMVIVIQIVGGFIPLIGTAWATLASGHLLGQLLRGSESPLTEVEAEPLGF